MARTYTLRLGQLTGTLPIVVGKTPPAGLTATQLVVVKAAAAAAIPLGDAQASAEIGKAAAEGEGE